MNTAMAENTLQAGLEPVRHSRRIVGPFHVERQLGGEAVLILSLSGSASIVDVCDGRRRVAVPKAGAVSILPPGCRFATTITGVTSALFFEFPWPLLASWIASEAGVRPEGVELETRICAEDDTLARSLLRLAAGASGERDAARHPAIDRVVRAHSNRAGARPRGWASGGLTPRQLSRVIDIVGSRPGSAPTLGEMAGEVGLSTSHFIRAFEAAVGRTPHRYVLNRRLERALEALLEGRDDIGDVAVATGFSHGSHLSRLLKRRFGVTPSAFRRCVLPQAVHGAGPAA